MKFLINSKTLLDFIKLALQYKSSRVRAGVDQLTFNALREISMPVEFIVHHDTFDIVFNQFRWQKVQRFLMDIPEQPVTVELYEDRIMISCEAVFVV